MSLKNTLFPIWRTLFILGILALSFFPSYGQQKISGKVTAQGEPLVGVSIIDKQSKEKTLTAEEGTFEIKAKKTDSLLFRYVGYESQTIYVGEQNIINVQLKVASSNLNELVVVGYGTQKKSDLTGAITSLSEDDFNKGVASSPNQLMQGKVSGVQIVRNSSEPGGGVSVSIRGASSINAGTGPLYVVDGLPIDNSPVVTGTGNEYVGTRSPSNPLSTINPADIKSIEVLKDASATAIYGARGANGVIIITTKNGSAGRLKMNYNAYFGVQNVAHKIDLLKPKEYKEVLNDLIAEGAASSENEVGKIINGGTNWQDEIFRKDAIVQNHNLSFTGGSKKAQYFVSLNYFDQDGVVKSSSFKRYSARVNLTLQATEQLELGLNLNTTYSKNDYAPIGFGINGEAGAIYGALNFDPTLPVRDSAGVYNISPFLDMDNPVAQLYGK
ncbi:MAG TPA: SusC/RagA family TonB-linked outer membrane protein, partial [Chitinophagaceae bacterium]|nr:SusC/RagA family TonB-linked outer membrane protein [Chitinophagaceae bacterium]